MASVGVTISGVLYDKTARTMRPVTLVGEASLTGLGVGGGPIIPEPPLGIWGPPGPWPTPPIFIPPGSPPGIWGPPGPWPTPPIHLPPGEGGGQPPSGGGGDTSGSIEWVYVPGQGWVLGYVPGDKPRPPPGAGATPPGGETPPPSGSEPHPEHPIAQPESRRR